MADLSVFIKGSSTEPFNLKRLIILASCNIYKRVIESFFDSISSRIIYSTRRQSFIFVPSLQSSIEVKICPQLSSSTFPWTEFPITIPMKYDRIPSLFIHCFKNCRQLSSKLRRRQLKSPHYLFLSMSSKRRLHKQSFTNK